MRHDGNELNNATIINILGIVNVDLPNKTADISNQEHYQTV